MRVSQIKVSGDENPGGNLFTGSSRKAQSLAKIVIEAVNPKVIVKKVFMVAVFSGPQSQGSLTSSLS